MVALNIEGRYETKIGTLQWHPAMAPRPLPQSWSSPSPPTFHTTTAPCNGTMATPPTTPNHSTLQWHPAMAPSNGTTSTSSKLVVALPPTIAHYSLAHYNGTLQWYPVRTPIAIAIWGKILIWKLFHAFGRIFALLAACFLFQRLFKKVLIWSVFKLLVFLFAGCLFVEVSSFWNQFGRKIRNLECGPLDLTLAIFCFIYLLNNKNLECRSTWIKRCYTQNLHISFQYFVAKVLIWKLFMFLVESPFAGWFFPLQRVIEKVLIWSVFNLLVFLFAGCLLSWSSYF